MARVLVREYLAGPNTEAFRRLAAAESSDDVIELDWLEITQHVNQLLMDRQLPCVSPFEAASSAATCIQCLQSLVTGNPNGRGRAMMLSA